jgi:ParB-like chromosome segregation protein Spo0J
MQIETWKIERLLPYAGNPRKNDQAIPKMAEAIKSYGFRVPVLARSTGDVIDGHLRIKAARHAGLTELPVIVCDDLTDQQVKAFRISINKMAELAQWDFDLLTVELEELRELDYDMVMTGFDLPEIDKLLDFDLSGDGGADGGGKKGKALITCPKCGFQHE